jgi:cathepsin L
MKFAFAAALLSAMAAAKMEPLAAPVTREGHFANGEVSVKTGAQVKDANTSEFEKFQDWTSKYNKSYKSSSEFTQRFANWSGLNKTIVKANAKADASGNPDAVRLAHNFLSDSTKEERAKLFAKNQMPPLVQSSAERPTKTGTIQTADWVSLGKVSPTKDQGSCGSCYSFSATTALESYIAIHENSDPLHLSEQEIVDCTSDFGNAGCGGGHEANVYNYISKYGITSNEDYPYFSGETVAPGECQVDQSTKRAVAQVSDYGIFSGARAQAEELQITPYAAGLQGENEYLYSYSSGILTSDECQYQYIDHGAPMVAFHVGDGATEEVPVYETVGDWETMCRYPDA